MLSLNIAQPAKFAAQIERQTFTGIFHIHSAYESRYLSTKRDVIIYLPPEYESERERRYPVLYLHDGQNLFDGATSYIPGMDWGIDKTVQSLLIQKSIEPMIIVGIYNTGGERVDEYTPIRDERFNAGGKAALYAQLIVEELKPFVDGRYRTLPDARNTGLGGSSLGGLVSLHIGLKYPQIFSKLAVMSPSVWWGGTMILREVEAIATKPPVRLWLDMGTAEGHGALVGARLLRDALLAKGWSLGGDLEYFEAEGAKHDEQAWGQRMDRILQYLFPTTRG